ncbi:TPA: hypothetical protein ACKTGI_002759 [Pseudomonas aeruginosa]
MNNIKTENPNFAPLTTKLIKEGGKQTPERFKSDMSEELNYTVKAFMVTLILFLLWKENGCILLDLFLTPESNYYYEHAATALKPGLQFLDHLISTTLKIILYITAGLFILITIIIECKDRNKSTKATE